MWRILMFQKFNILIINLHCDVSFNTVKAILILSLYKMTQLLQLHKVELTSLLKMIVFEQTKFPCKKMFAINQTYLQKLIINPQNKKSSIHF